MLLIVLREGDDNALNHNFLHNTLTNYREPNNRPMTTYHMIKLNLHSNKYLIGHLPVYLFAEMKMLYCAVYHQSSCLQMPQYFHFCQILPPISQSYDKAMFRTIVQNHPCLFPWKLFIKFGDVVVPLGLEAGPGHRSTETILLTEALDFKFSTIVPRAVGEDRFGAVQCSWLFIHQPHVTMEAWKKKSKQTQ